MQFIEHAPFTRWLKANVTDDEYRDFQNDLIADPELGSMIANTGGFRKARIKFAGRGKRGSGRVIYYWLSDSGRVHFVFGYSKNEQADLTDQQKKVLRTLVEQLD